MLSQTRPLRLLDIINKAVIIQLRISWNPNRNSMKVNVERHHVGGIDGAYNGNNTRTCNA